MKTFLTVGEDTVIVLEELQAVQEARFKVPVEDVRCTFFLKDRQHPITVDNYELSQFLNKLEQVQRHGE